MSETVARHRPSVDLDDFARRLQTHQAPHESHEDDPLAELARIVGDQPDPYGDVFAQQPVAAAQHAELRPSYQPHGGQPLGRREPTLDTGIPRFSADFAAIEAGLRAASPASPPAHAPQQAYAEPHFDQHADQAYPDQAYPEDGHPDYDHQQDPAFGPPPQSWAEPAAAKPPRATARRPVYVMAASIAVAIVGIGVAFAYKGTGSSPREIKTIMAAAGPTKEQPPADQAASADQDASASQQASTKLVNHEEQPVDLNQAVQDNAAARGEPDAANVPVPPSPGQAAGQQYASLGANQDSAGSGAVSPAYTSDQAGFGVGMPQPKRVKSVSVTPDGRIVNEAAAPAPDPIANVLSGAPAAKPGDRAGPSAQTQTPKSSNRATKTTTPHRAPAAQTADDGGDDAAVPAQKPAKPTKKAKNVKVATAETGATDATDSTASTAEEDKPAGSGGFAVQLAAPGSEADARSTTSKLLKKYSGALHGRRLGFHRAEANGKTVYRVRVSSLTKEDAASLCSKLKADGGTCFIAKN